MKLWRKLLAAVTAGTICLGSIGAMLSVSAETELDSPAVSENSTEVKASKVRITIITVNLRVVLMVVMDGILIIFIIVVMGVIHQWEMGMLVNMLLIMDLRLMKVMKLEE